MAKKKYGKPRRTNGPDLTPNELVQRAQMALAQGYSIREAAKDAGVNEKTIDRWRKDIEFTKEVDRLSHMLGAAGRAERLRIAMRVVRQKTKGNRVQTRRDLLDWLKLIQSETDGIKLNLAAELATYSSLAGGGSTGPGEAG